MVNGYDFDGTIYDGDSSVDFYFYCLKRNKKVLLQLPVQLWGLILYLLHIIDKTRFKEKVFSFLKRVDDIDSYVKDFWNENINNIKKWYLRQKEKTDIIISASPEFLLKPLEKKLKIKVIASKVDKKNGKFLEKNCHDFEKVKRLNKEEKNIQLKSFYSDSMSDKPMMDISEKSFLVKKNQIIELSKKTKKKENCCLKFNAKIILFLIIFISIVLLIPIIQASFYNYPSADDYSYTQLTMNIIKDQGFLSVIINAFKNVYRVYNSWQGTFSAVLLFSLQPNVWGNSFYFLTTIIIIFLLFFSLKSLFKTIFYDGFKISKCCYYIITIIFTMLCIQTLPDKTQGLFWWNGASYYMAFFSLELIELSLLVKYSILNKKSRNKLLLICFISAFISGGNYITALQQIIIMFIFNVYMIIIKKDKSLLLPFFIAITGLLISGIAPGNKTRADMVVGMNPIKAILLSFVYAFEKMIEWINPLIFIIILIITIIVFPRIYRINYKYKNPLIVFVTIFCVFSAEFTPTLYSTSSIGEGRLWNIMYISYLLFYLMISIYITGYFINILVEKRAINHENLDKIHAVFSEYRIIFFAISLLFIGIYMYNNRYDMTSYLTYHTLKNNEAQTYSKEYKYRIKQLEDNSIKDITFDEFSVYPCPLFYSDIGENPNDWRNEPIAKIYHKNSVRLIKRGDN